METTNETKNVRYLSLDIVRGLALFGILLINIPVYNTGLFDMPLLPSMEEGTNVDRVLAMFVEKKFYSLFSFLFGLGFYIFATRAEQKGRKPLALFARRMVALLVLGIIHLFFFIGSILAMYAFVGFFLLPFYRRQTKTIGYWILGLLAVHTFGTASGLFSVYSPMEPTLLVNNDLLIIFILFLSGLWFGKMRLFEPTEASRVLLVRLLLVTLPVTLIGFGVIGWTYGSTDTPLYVGLFAIPMAYTYVSGLFLVFRNESVARRWMPVARVGQMAFTNYLMQNVLGLALITALGYGVGEVTTTDALWMALVIYGIELIWSTLYFKKWRIGPFEWMWRKMTYGFSYKPS